MIGQGDANGRAIQCWGRVASPAVALNVTGMERVWIRELAMVFGGRFGERVEVVGEEAEVAWLFDASRSYEWFGPPTVCLEEMIDATVGWCQRGGVILGKPTPFEVRDGAYRGGWMMEKEIRELIRGGVAIPAHPLALTAGRKLDVRWQRARTRYYLEEGVGGVAVGWYQGPRWR